MLMLMVDGRLLSRRPEDFQTKDLLPMEGKTVGSLLVIDITQLHALGKGECAFCLSYFLTTDLRFACSTVLVTCGQPETLSRLAVL